MRERASTTIVDELKVRVILAPPVQSSDRWAMYRPGMR